MELGCGHGRVLGPLADKAAIVVGIDTSLPSLGLAKELLSDRDNCYLAGMDAVRLAIPPNAFDVVVCIQNGISAFHVEQRRLIEESLRVIRPGGLALFSTYAPCFWDDRLAWFELQAQAGLVGQIDYERTGDGDIVCQDGFTAGTVGRENFVELTSGLGAGVELLEVDDSSLFCRLTKS